MKNIFANSHRNPRGFTYSHTSYSVCEMHRTDLVNRAFDRDMGVGAQIHEEKPAQDVPTLNTLSNMFLENTKHTVWFECVCTNPRTHVMEPWTLTKARVFRLGTPFGPIGIPI